MNQAQQATSRHNGASAEARLISSRQELRDLLVEPEDEQSHTIQQFPRSKLMRLITGNGGVALLAVGAGGILLARPRLLMRAIRMVPMGALMRLFADKFLSR